MLQPVGHHRTFVQFYHLHVTANLVVHSVLSAGTMMQSVGGLTPVRWQLVIDLEGIPNLLLRRIMENAIFNVLLFSNFT